MRIAVTLSDMIMSMPMSISFVFSYSYDTLESI